MVHFRSMVAGMAISAVVSTAAVAETWDMPTPYPDATFHTQNIREFATDVAEATDGKLEINVHSAGSLFKHPEIKNAVRGRQVPIGEFLLSRLSNENPVFAVDSIPFLATDYVQAKKLWQASRPTISALLAEEGMTLLYVVPWPPQGLYAKRPIESVEDLRGLKFRAYNAETERLAQLGGAVPTQVEVADLAQAFATGRVDAMITSPSTGVSNKAWDFVSHYYDTRAWLPKNAVVVNTRAFRALDPAVQTAVLNAAVRAENRGWEMSAKETQEKTQVLADNGMTVAEPSAELKQGLNKIGETMTSEWVETAGDQGREIIDIYQNR